MSDGPPGTRDALVAALRRGGLVDITTRGRLTGLPRRIEIAAFGIDGRVYLSGLPGRRGWLANVRADPRVSVHLKGRIRGELTASARIIEEASERRRLLEHITRQWRRAHQLEAFVARSPLVELVLDEAGSVDPGPGQE